MEQKSCSLIAQEGKGYQRASRYPLQEHISNDLKPFHSASFLKDFVTSEQCQEGNQAFEKHTRSRSWVFSHKEKGQGQGHS